MTTSIKALFLIETLSPDNTPAVFGYIAYDRIIGTPKSYLIISERNTQDLSREYGIPIQYVKSIKEAREIAQ